MQRIFTRISQINLWQSTESVSGRGSELACTAPLRASLPNLLAELEVTSILDAPCGDFNWMRYVPLSGITYTGMDVVPALAERNQQAYGSDTIRFITGDITRDSLPKADLIICRDCLVHLPLRDAYYALKQFQASGAKYLLLTTYPETKQNRDTPAGSWRALNLCLPPFNLKAPMQLLSDPSDDTGAHPDKAMGLWRLDTLTLPENPPSLLPEVLLTTFIRKHFNPSWRL